MLRMQYAGMLILPEQNNVYTLQKESGVAIMSYLYFPDLCLGIYPEDIKYIMHIGIDGKRKIVRTCNKRRWQ